jgi:hypothetical protein
MSQELLLLLWHCAAAAAAAAARMCVQVLVFFCQASCDQHQRCFGHLPMQEICVDMFCCCVQGWFV